METFKKLVTTCVRNNISDLHLRAGSAAAARKNGQLHFQRDIVFSAEELEALLHELTTDRQRRILAERWSVDFSAHFPDAQMRLNAFRTADGLGMAIRFLPSAIPDFEALNLHPSLRELCSQPHVGTLSKALGSQGGYVAGRVETIELLRNRGRSFIFSTALPPAVLGAALAALRHLKSNPGAGARLMRISKDIRDHLNGLGFDTMGSTTQIIPVACGRNRVALHAQALLRGEGLLVAAVRPPTVPQGTARLRLSLRADLTDEDLKRIRLGFSRLRVSFFP